MNSSARLSRFNLIFASDSQRGIARGGKTPWSSEEDANFFRNVTTGRGKNVVIVGRKTFEGVFKKRHLSKRATFVISRGWQQENYPGIHIFSSIKDALTAAANGNYDEVWIGGGCSVYEEVTSRWMYLCDNIHWTQFKIDYKCDTHFPEEILEGLPLGKEPVKTQSLVRHHLAPNYGHREEELLNLLRRLISDEGGLLTEKHLYGESFEFNLAKNFPFLTTNQVDPKYIIRLFLFALKGGCDVAILKDQESKVLYTKLAQKTSMAAHEAKDDGLEDGDMGPWWGWYMRNWGVSYESYSTQYTGTTDQLLVAVDEIIKTRKSVISLRDRSQDQYSAVANRYSTLEFIATSDRAHLDALVHVHSMEVIEELKNDVAIFGLFLLAMASFVKCRPRTLKFIVNDLWCPFREPVEKQVQRTPLPFPVLSIRNHGRVNAPEDLDVDSWIIKFRDSWSIIDLPREGMVTNGKGVGGKKKK